jgi:hypothetical protein
MLEQFLKSLICVIIFVQLLYGSFVLPNQFIEVFHSLFFILVLHVLINCCYQRHTIGNKERELRQVPTKLSLPALFFLYYYYSRLLLFLKIHTKNAFSTCSTVYFFIGERIPATESWCETCPPTSSQSTR